MIVLTLLTEGSGWDCCSSGPGVYSNGCFETGCGVGDAMRTRRGELREKDEVRRFWALWMAPMLAVLLLSVGCAGPGRTVSPRFAGSPGDMQNLVDWALVDPLEGAGGSVGVVVLDMRGRVLAEHDGDRLLTPASIEKLGTTADALLQLPPEFRWRTALLADGEVRGDTLYGNLLLVGGWDPTLAGPAPYSDWPWRRFDEAAKRLYLQGIHHITGDLIGVGKLFVPGVWEAGDLFFRYAPSVSELSWNDGLLTTWAGMLDTTEMRGLLPDSSMWSAEHASSRIPHFEEPPGWVWKPDSLQALFQRKADPMTAEMDETNHAPVPDPRWLAMDAFRISLRRAGIGGGEETRVTATLPEGNLRELAVLEGERRDVVLEGMLSVSSNLWAEMVAASINEREGRGRPGSPAWMGALDSLGVPQRGLRATDACGLARSNALCARTWTELLVAAYDRWGEEWMHLLPYPEKPLSTLSKRLVGEGDRLVVKTGSLSRVRSLAGYVLDDEGRPMLAFTVIANNAAIDSEPLLDDFARRLAELTAPRPEER